MCQVAGNSFCFYNVSAKFLLYTGICCRQNRNHLAVPVSSDVNKDLGLKAKDSDPKAKDSDPKAKAKDLSHTAKAKDSDPKAKDLSHTAKAKDLDFGLKDQGQVLTSLPVSQSQEDDTHVRPF